MKTNVIEIPVHPDEYNVPVSHINIELSTGRYATITGPLGRKTLTALIGTLKANKETLCAKTEEDFSI
jgi:hypothetical protein